MTDWTQFFQPSSFGSFAPSYSFDDYAPQYQRAARYNELPASANIEDRRAEPIDWWRHAVATATDLTPEQWGTAMRHPLTPFKDLFWRDLPPGDYQNSLLAKQAGIDSIGMGGAAAPFAMGGRQTQSE